MADRIGIMIDGRLEQLDTPDVIYHSPATPSVARMAGMCDLLDGVLHGDRVATEAGAVRCIGNDGVIPDGSAVQVLVHPDDFQVVVDPQGSCTVRSREFRGDETILVVQTASGATLRCRQRSDSTLTPGSQVSLIPTKVVPFVAFRR